MEIIANNKLVPKCSFQDIIHISDIFQDDVIQCLYHYAIYTHTMQTSKYLQRKQNMLHPCIWFKLYGDIAWYLEYVLFIKTIMCSRILAYNILYYLCKNMMYITQHT